MKQWTTKRARLLQEWFRDRLVQKSILKRTADVLEKLGIAGMALGVFQSRVDGAIWGGVFLVLSYVFSIWEAKK